MFLPQFNQFIYARSAKDFREHGFSGNNLYAYHYTRAFSTRFSTSTETVVRLLRDAIKDVQNKTSGTERADASIESDVIINGSLNQNPQKFTLNERQDMQYKIARSYLLYSFQRSLLKLVPETLLRMHILGETGTGKSRVVEALKYLSLS